MKKNTLKDGLDAKKDAKREAKSSFCCSERESLACKLDMVMAVLRFITTWMVTNDTKVKVS